MPRSRHHQSKITSQDVASHAGVSRATVSAVLNGSRYVSEALIRRVQDAVDALGYTPNVVARSLKTQRTHTIGLVIPNVLSPIWALITRSVELRARELGFNTIICDTDEDPATERDCVNLLTAKQVDGLIIAPCGVDSEERLMPLFREKPLVFVDRAPHTLPVDYITPDKPAGAETAVRHLVEQGARRIAIIGNTNPGQETYLDDEWLGGYKNGLRAAGLPLDERLIRMGRRGPHSESDGYTNTLALLRQSQPPDAIIACTHFTTMGVLRAARELHVAIPDDLALVGYEEVIYTEYVKPSLSVVHQPWDDVGRLAVDVLVRRLDSGIDREQPDLPQHYVLPVRLIIRDSSRLAVKNPSGSPRR